MNEEIINTKPVLEKELAEVCNAEGIANLTKTIDIFLKILEHYKLSEIMDSILIPTENFTGLQLKTARTNLASKFETYIKTIYETLNIEIEGELKVCLVEFFKRFGFLKLNNDSYKFFEKDDITLVSKYSTDYFKGKMPFGKEMKLSYDLRNAILHKGKLFGDISPSNDSVSIDVKSFLYSLLFVTNKFLPLLSAKFEESDSEDYTEYLAKVKTNFQKWQSRFIHLKGKEEFEEILLFAKETDWEFNNQENEVREKREGTVDSLRKKLSIESQYQMVIVGDAGMGKSTTMQYLAYKDASNKNAPIPIYIELKLLISDLSIEDYIADKYSLSKQGLLQQLKLGKITLFLDGLNEVLPSIKQKIYISIKKLIKDYPKTFVLMSSRQQDYKNEFENVPVFDLQKMNISQIQEFLQKNTNQNAVRQIILDAIKGNSNWEKILGTPLMLFMLIKVVALENEIPNDENKIILKFIKNLYIRERHKDVSFDTEYFHSLISYFAFEGIEIKGNTNSGMNFSEIETVLRKKEMSLGTKDVLLFLKKASELSIMVEDEKLYSFAHQSYQETLAGDYFNSIFA
jgi:NACHT domain